MPQRPGTTCMDALVSRETGCRERLAESGLFRAIVQPALPACPGTRTLHELCGLARDYDTIQANSASLILFGETKGTGLTTNGIFHRLSCNRILIL